MLKKLSLILLLGLVGPLAARATVELDGIRYETDASTKTASVIGPDKDTDDIPELIIPESITDNGDEYIVTSIGAGAFSACHITKISIPKTIVSIESRAFYYCLDLCEITFSESQLPTSNLESIGSQAFTYCSALQSIGDMPKLEQIGYEAFAACTSLQSVGNLPELNTIEPYVFYDCKSLQSIGDMPKLEIVGSLAFKNTNLSDVYIPASIMQYSVGAVTYPTRLHFAGINPPRFDGSYISTIVFVPDEAKENYANRLKDMTPVEFISEGVQTDFVITVSAKENDSDVLNKVNEGIDKDRVLNILNLKVSGTINSYDIIVLRNKMVNLRKLDLSEATIVASSYEYYTGCHTENNIVGNNMFRELKLTEVTLPDNVTRIGNSAFYHCLNLQAVNLPKSLEVIENNAFQGCSSLLSVDFPTTITDIGSSSFEGCSNLKEITFPKELISQSATIGAYTFANCSSLTSVILPNGITSMNGYIYNGTFENCTKLQSVVLPPSLTSISDCCFRNCSSLSSISMPPTLKSIAGRAFEGCTNLRELRIPAGINTIGDNAIPKNVWDVYTYTIQPTSIGQNTFASSTYLTATLHVPETSESLYYWDTQWSQFQSIENFNEPYSYFYLDDKDLIEDPETPRIDGETDEETGDKKNPDADLGQGSGLIVEGDESQDLGTVELEADGKGNGATIIGGDSNNTESGGNVNIDMLKVNIPITANKWYFFAFPFDVDCENIKFNGQMVWRYYDGEWRAMYGSGAWKDAKDQKLERGKGYIFQGSKSGTLTLTIPNVHFDAQSWNQTLDQFVAENAQDASWNFIGNPYQSYYELADLGFDGPITWWNPNTNSYEAFSPQDDDLSMYPFMAFFVQKTEGVDAVEFDSEYRETNNQKNDPSHRAAARKRRNARRAKSATSEPRLLINLTVTDGVNGDRTRVVFNNLASEAYEVGVDASKFESTEAPQIYSLDAKNVRYAINERPMGDGVVNLGFYAPASGVFTIECTRNDCPVTLKDCKSGRVVTLTKGATYEFTAEKGFDESRFVLNAEPAEMTATEDALADPTKDAKYYGVNGLETDGNRPGLMIEVKGTEATKVIRK